MANLSDPYNTSHNPNVGCRHEHSGSDVYCRTCGARLRKSKFGAKYCPVDAGKQTIKMK